MSSTTAYSTGSRTAPMKESIRTPARRSRRPPTTPVPSLLVLGSMAIIAETHPMLRRLAVKNMILTDPSRFSAWYAFSANPLSFLSIFFAAPRTQCLTSPMSSTDCCSLATSRDPFECVPHSIPSRPRPRIQSPTAALMPVLAQKYPMLSGTTLHFHLNVPKTQQSPRPHCAHVPWRTKITFLHPNLLDGNILPLLLLLESPNPTSTCNPLPLRRGPRDQLVTPTNSGSSTNKNYQHHLRCGVGHSNPTLAVEFISLTSLG